MDLAEYNLYTNLSLYNIPSRILELLPEFPETVESVVKGCYLFRGPRMQVATWMHHDREAAIAFQLLLLKNLEQNECKGFLYPLPFKDGRTYTMIDNDTSVYMTNWPEMRKVHFHQAVDLEAIIELITDFRNHICHLGVSPYQPTNRKIHNLIDRFSEIIEQFQSFILLAKYRLHPTYFDRLFLEYAPLAVQQTKHSIELLMSSQYLDRFHEGLYNNGMIINNLSRGNLRLSSFGSAICLQLDDWHKDLPVFDLAILLNKTGRSYHWNQTWFENLIKLYSERCPVSQAEFDIIIAYLVFPWGFYRIATRYYLNLVDWSLQQMVEKLERILNEERLRIGLLRGLMPYDINLQKPS